MWEIFPWPLFQNYQQSIESKTLIYKKVNGQCDVSVLIWKIFSNFVKIWAGYGHEESPWIHRNDVQSHIYSGYHAGYSNPYSGYYQGYRQRRWLINGAMHVWEWIFISMTRDENELPSTGVIIPIRTLLF